MFKRILGAAAAGVSCIALMGCAAEDTRTYAELKLDSIVVPENMDLFNERSDEFWHMVHEEEPTMTQAREYVSTSMIDQLLDETHQWTWDNAAKALKGQHLFQPVNDLVEETRTQSTPLSKTEIEVKVSNTYQVQYALTGLPQRVQCESYETWIAESGTWKLDKTDKSSCDNKLASVTPL